jgi:hypothetical protein
VQGGGWRRREAQQHEVDGGRGDPERNGGAGDWRGSSRNPFSAAWLPPLPSAPAPDGKEGRR